jgi:PAS domain S-box-containing protein
MTQTAEHTTKTQSSPRPVPSEIVQKWQEIVDLLAEIMRVPSALVMRVEPPNIKVFVSSQSTGNPYEPDEVASLNTGLYCETVMKTRQPLLVPNALQDEEWKSNPDIKLGMISYLGFPVSWPDGEIFGTICVLDNKKNEYSTLYRKLLLQFRNVVQADLRSLATVHAELATQKAHLEELFARVPEAIVQMDGDGRVARVNPEFTKIFGYAEGEVLGRSLNDLIVPEELRAEAEEFTSRVNDRGEILTVETVRSRKNGTRVPVSMVRVPVMSEGRQISAYAIYRDITERKRAEDELRKVNEELEQRVIERTIGLEAANKELEAFAHSVSHDLRAPLRHIAGYAELLQKNASTSLDEKSQRYMAVILESTKRMGDLIDDLLAFSRVGRAEIQKTMVSLEQVVKEALSEVQQETDGSNLVWRIGALPEVYVDRSLLRLALVNLISNAVKFTRTRPQAEIEIGSTDKKKDEIVVFISDNGVGFDMKYVNKLFGVFQRLHRAEEFEGTGIGLATVQRIIHRHGGRVWAEGLVNKGATFYFSVPKSYEG